MTQVKRRRVLYIPGYDPFPPRRYRELYRREGSEQARLSGYALSQTRSDDPHAWNVTAEMEGARVDAEIEVLVWSDIVASSMSSSILATYRQLLRTAWVYLASGALFRLMRLRKGPVLAALYPVVVLLAQLSAALLAGWAAAAVVQRALDALPTGAETPAAPMLAGVIAGAAVAWGLLRWFKAKDNRLFAHYLMHDYAFTARWNGAYPAALEARLADFADRVEAALASGADEVLVVGHSSGAHLGISLLADMVRSGRIPRGRCAFLSLGQVVPMVSFLKGANRLRADLHLMGSQDLVPWVDVTAPGDGCAFAICDPVAVSGVAPSVRTGPLMLSAAFTQTLSSDKWAALKRRYFRLHFQYLCAFDALPGKPGDFDYFRVTAGPMPLAERFAGRANSPSTLSTAVNRHTGMAA